MHNLILSMNFSLTIEAEQRLALRKPRVRPWTLNLHVKTWNVPLRPSASLNMLSNLRGAVQMKLFCLKWFSPPVFSSLWRVKNAEGKYTENNWSHFVAKWLRGAREQPPSGECKYTFKSQADSMRV